MSKPVPPISIPPAALDDLKEEPTSPISPRSPLSPPEDELIVPEAEPMCCLTACLSGILSWLHSWWDYFCGPGEGLSEIEACEQGDVNRMLAFISKDEALHQLFIYRHYDKVPALLDAGANVNARNEQGDTVLHRLCANAGEPIEVGGQWLLDILVARGADVNAVGSRGRTPLMRAAAVHGLQYATQLVQQHSANVHIVGEKGTALHIACATGQLGLVDILTRNGASIMAQDARGRTPLHHLASHVNNIDSFDEVGKARKPIVQFFALLPGFDPNVRDQDGCTPLHLACKEGSGKKTGLLLKLKADPNAIGPRGRTPIHYAAKFGHADLIPMIARTAGANVNAQDQMGDTPLMLLCRNPEHLDHETKKAAAKALLDCRANPKISSYPDKQGRRMVPNLAFLHHTKPPVTKAEERKDSTEELKEPVKPVAALTNPAEALLLAASDGQGTFVPPPKKA